MKFDQLASKQDVEETIKNLKQRGVSAELVETKQQALEKIKKLIPPNSDVMTASSLTLKEVGFTDLLKSDQHKWNNLKQAIVNQKDPDKQQQLRKLSVTADYFLGSVHAITKQGVIMTASGSGSQLPSYAFSSKNVIFVVGTQKIVDTFDNGLKRLREYSLPLEDKRMKSIGQKGSVIGKILIFEKEIMDRNLKLIFINEKLGF